MVAQVICSVKPLIYNAESSFSFDLITPSRPAPPLSEQLAGQTTALANELKIFCFIALRCNLTFEVGGLLGVYYLNDKVRHPDLTL